jgi:ABC-2 type transport system ATP-binding protein
MLQRAGLAQALMGDPELLILDEPMTGLDPIGRKEVRDLILEERTQGRTVMFSSHILSDVEMLCDRVAIVHRGEMSAYGALSELLRSGDPPVEVELAVTDEALRSALSAKALRVAPDGDTPSSRSRATRPPTVMRRSPRRRRPDRRGHPAQRDPRRPLRAQGHRRG